jgi:Mg2+ and Co2+ transporter CorA
MPELRDPNAYYLLIAIAAIVITVEVIVFKVKRWF